ncbi:hypothetical protein HID58_018251 [Brassica napus]|uniref:Uncharacterized protein n=3 Tax=Brassica TaxID=3705 RepID=A0ABQ8D9D7_BRANA|nr:hypothetical protein HID58_018251 [Brassica napus]CDY24353.1 BnaA07g02780D [Brassica napus]
MDLTFHLELFDEAVARQVSRTSGSRNLRRDDDSAKSKRRTSGSRNRRRDDDSANLWVENFGGDNQKEKKTRLGFIGFIGFIGRKGLGFVESELFLQEP